MKYTGHERDENAGMDYMLARYMTLNTARFLSSDRMLRSASPPLVGTWNRYAYVANDPISDTDPTGNFIRVGGDRVDAIVRIMTRAAQTPTGRQYLAALADSSSTYTFEHESRNEAATVAAVRAGEIPEATLAYGVYHPETNTAAVDVDVTDLHPEQSMGVATLVHEAVHAEGHDSGLSPQEIIQRDHDERSGGTGKLAITEGSKAAREWKSGSRGEGNISRREARALVQRWLREGEECERRLRRREDDPN
ncbi:MAG: RHS repeat-associated core domain-containing protein [Acidobacteria bacterium]|nr:RHS repeat-associated core domain-containing protein [Acidobacteriota bacterium]